MTRHQAALRLRVATATRLKDSIERQRRRMVLRGGNARPADVAAQDDRASHQRRELGPEVDTSVAGHRGRP
jgi:hypothetical protein